MASQILFVLAVFISVGAPPGASEPEVATLSAGDSIEARIDDDDSSCVPVHTPALDGRASQTVAVGRGYRLVIDEPGAYSIEMRSHLFDAYLVLRDEAGAVVAEDDDRLLATHSRIVVELEKGDSYRVQACALHGGRGPFTLMLRRGKPEAMSRTARMSAEIEDAREAVGALEEALGEDHVRVAKALDKLATYLQRVGSQGAARRAYERVLAIYEKARGPEHADTALALYNLAGHLRMQGSFVEAKRLLERSQRICDTVLGPEHRNTMNNRDRLAGVLLAQGEYDLARQMFERTLASREATLGPEHLDTGMSLNNLALLLKRIGAYDRALPLYRRALSILEKAHGPEHPTLIPALNNLGSLLMAQGSLEAARSDLARALAIAEATLPPKHLDTATTLNSLGWLLYLQGEYEPAGVYLERALAIREQVLGDRNPQTGASLNNLAVLVQARGDLGRAAQLLERSLDIAQRMYGSNHPQVALAINNLAALHRDRRDYDAARTTGERAVRASERALGPNHPDMAVSLNNLGLVLKVRGELEESARCYERTLAILESTLGPEHPRSLTTRRNLLLLDLDRGASASLFDDASLLSDRGLEWVLGQLALSPSERGYELSADQKGRIDLLVSSLASGEDRPGRLDATWSRITSWKGLVFRHLSRLSRLLAASRISPEVAALQGRLRGLDRRLSEHAYARRIDDPKAHRAAFEEIRVERDQVETQLLMELDINPARESTTARDLSKLLPKGSALLDFYTHRPYRPSQRDADGRVIHGQFGEPPRMLCWIIRAGDGKPHLVDLGEIASLRASVQDYLATLVPDRHAASRVTPGAGSGAGAESDLRRVLWEPLASRLDGVDRIFVAPDGCLAELPFAAIRVDEKSYLIEKADVIYVQDPVTLRDRLEGGAPKRDGAPSLLGVGGIDYDAITAPAAKGGSAPSAASGLRGSGGLGHRGFSGRFSALSKTGHEVSAIHAIHESVFKGRASTMRLSGGAATKDAFIAGAPGRAVIHIATHGFYERDGIASLWEVAIAKGRDEERIAFSRPARDGGRRAPPAVNTAPPELLAGLVFAGVNERAPTNDDDGILTAEEVAGMDLGSCDLVILSACETALGTGRSGEGLLSLRRAFREAGAKTVIASLWKVDDDAACELLVRFYEKLWRDQMSPAAALRAARLSLLREAPRYWAAFTVSGEWR